MKQISIILFTTLLLLSCNAQKANQITSIEFEKAIKATDIQLLDVRTKEEYQQGHIANALQANWNDDTEFEKRTTSLNLSKHVYVYCLSGGRSASAASNLRKKGYNVVELKGGISAWRNANLPTEGNGNVEKGMELKVFTDSLAKSELVLVDFGAKWCPPCIKMNPVLDSLQTAMPTLKIIKVDLDRDKEICKAYGVTELPVFQFYKKAKSIKIVKGIMTLKEMETILE